MTPVDLKSSGFTRPDHEVRIGRAATKVEANQRPFQQARLGATAHQKEKQEYGNRYSQQP